jgi:hypothetical protein
LNSKLLFLILTVASAIAVPVCVMGQVAPERPPKNLATGPEYKYDVFLGYGYTSLNQVSQSRSGLGGIAGSVTRGITEHFAVKFDGGHYLWNTTATNAGHPTVDMFLGGAVVRGNLFEKWSIYTEGLMGGIHTGGVAIQPDVSFAGGIGIGMDYNRNARLSIRAYGDYLGSSFTITPYQPGFSPHTRWNARAGIGAAYHF